MATKLLLADDSITIHKVVSLTFADEDVEVIAVTNGSEALEKACEERPDIILADVFMPGKNGYEVCNGIKSDPALSTIPVVLLVGTFEAFDAQEAARVRCDAHLTKPFDTSELMHVINNLVGRRETETHATPPLRETGAALPDTASVRGVAEPRIDALISPRTRESFLGEQHILDIFDFSTPEAAPVEEAPPLVAAEVMEPAGEQEPAQPRPVIPFPGTGKSAESAAAMPLSPEVIDQIVEKVVQRMSENIVRDIAWEVVPALSELMIRQYLDELKANNKL